MCNLASSQWKGQDQAYLFMGCVDPSRHFQCLALDWFKLHKRRNGCDGGSLLGGRGCGLVLRAFYEVNVC